MISMEMADTLAAILRLPNGSLNKVTTQPQLHLSRFSLDHSAFASQDDGKSVLATLIQKHITYLSDNFRNGM